MRRGLSSPEGAVRSGLAVTSETSDLDPPLGTDEVEAYPVDEFQGHVVNGNLTRGEFYVPGGLNDADFLTC